jgi:hypothetical protein
VAAEAVSIAYRVGDNFADPMDKLVDQGTKQLNANLKANDQLQIDRQHAGTERRDCDGNLMPVAAMLAGFPLLFGGNLP